MDDLTCRYTESKGYWLLSVMDGTGTLDLNGPLGDQPSWLIAIRDAAKLSGDGWFSDSNVVVWFRMDYSNNLTEYVKWMVS